MPLGAARQQAQSAASEQAHTEQRLGAVCHTSWHKVKTRNWHHFEALFLLPCCPDFNLH